MKVKPLTTHRDEPALKAVVTAPIPRELTAQRAYQQLVTSQNVSPDRAKQLLGTTHLK